MLFEKSVKSDEKLHNYNIKKTTLQFFKAIYYTKGSNLCSLNLLVMNILRDRVAYIRICQFYIQC